MRFLIFNIMVLASLAYLVTASPGTSPTQWARQFPDMFKTALDGHIDEHLGSKSTAMPELPAELKKGSQQVVKNLKQTYQQVMPETSAQPKIGKDAGPKQPETDLQKLVEKTVNQAMEKAAKKAQPKEQLVKQEELQTPIATAKQDTAPAIIKDKAVADLDENQSAATVAQKPAQQKKETQTDAELEAAFSSLMADKAQLPEQNAVVASYQKGSDTSAAQSPQFMTSGQRQSSLARVMQDMELFYLERVMR